MSDPEIMFPKHGKFDDCKDKDCENHNYRMCGKCNHHLTSKCACFCHVRDKGVMIVPRKLKRKDNKPELNQ